MLPSMLVVVQWPARRNRRIVPTTLAASGGAHRSPRSAAHLLVVSFLSPAERKGNCLMAACVSKSMTRKLTLDW